MIKSTAILAVAIFIPSVSAVPAHAARKAHRPWFSSARPQATPKPEPIAVQPAHIRPTDFSRSSTRAVSKRPGDRIAEQAILYKGTRYRFGGDSKSRGFDCSGLVRRIYDDLDLRNVPHNSSGLYRMGQSVRLNDLRPGDLVFFKNTYRSGISHVGVYAGNNHFIHAQNRRHGVSMTSLADPYYQLHYAGARRLY